MRFLCLHGFGTNSSILETQLTGLTKKLGPGHEFIFVDGEEEVGRARGVSQIWQPIKRNNKLTKLQVFLALSKGHILVTIGLTLLNSLPRPWNLSRLS